MSQQVNNPESGLRNHRVEFVREDNLGETPADPEFEQYSTSISELSWSSDATIEARRGLGNPDPIEHLRGPESHEVEITYDMVKFLTQNGGEAYDASYDALPRDFDNKMANSHTFIDREDKGAVTAANTYAGDESRATRVYTVARGGLIDEGSLNGDPSDSQPVTVELSYVFQKARSFKIDQPNASTQLAVVSTSADDTGIDVTIEDEGAGTTETVTLNGTTAVETTAEFTDIDAFELSGETQGDVTLHEYNSTDGMAEAQLSIIHGIESYRGIEGDLGVPALGAGSREDLTGQSVQTFLGDVIHWSGEPFPHEVQSMTVTAANNVEDVERSQSFSKAIFAANRELTAEATMYGEAATHHLLTDHLLNNVQNLQWQMKAGTITLENCSLTEPGERAAEAEEAVLTTDNTFTATGMTISEN